MSIYLDNSATTRCCEAAKQAVLETLCEDFYNPHALYAPAVMMERKIEEARSDMAAAMGVATGELYFCSGGTEADNIALLGHASRQRNQNARYICGPAEHSAVYQCFEELAESGADVHFLHCDEKGNIDLAELREVINESTVLVSVMHVNNEFGAVANIQNIAQIVHEANPHTYFHSDGVQAFGHLPPSKIAADAYSISAHKFHGPKGTGALMLRKTMRCQGQRGGGQENGLRSGTLNTGGILGMAAAYADWAQNSEKEIEHSLTCKKALADALLSLPDVLLNGPEINKGAPHILNVSFMGVRGEVLLHALEEKDIYVATGATCSSKKKGKNRVLSAIGVTDARAESALRFSLGRFNTREEMDEVANAVAELLPTLRRFHPR